MCMNCTFRELFNLLRVMKIVILFMLIGLTHLSAEVRSQNASVSLKLKDATIEQVILEVEKQLRWVLSIPFFISCIRQQNPLTVLSKIILRELNNLIYPQKK